MVFFLFLASVIVLRRIVSEEKLSSVEASPDIKPSQSLSSVASPTVASTTVASPTVALPTAASTSLGRDLSQLSSVLSEWGEGAAIRKESSVSKDNISKDSVAAEAKD